MHLGPYQLTRRLGKGGMGEVWLAKRVTMGDAAKTVAVKLLHTSGPMAPEAVDFVREAKLAMLLRHSTIVQVNDVGESQGLCFMEMEWVDGVDLACLNKHLRENKRTLPVSVAAYVTGELLKALAFAHALDVDGKTETVVHRDVSPQNVLISKSGEVKLTDFGIAFMTSDKTSSDLIKGKARYMSAEHVRQAREPCIDIFGGGAIFHEMVDGRKFRHTAETNIDLLAMAFSGAVPPLSIELPVELEALRHGLLTSDASQQFRSARAALSTLRNWQGYRDESEELANLVRGVGNLEPTIAVTEVLTTILDPDESTGEGCRRGAPAEMTELLPSSLGTDESTIADGHGVSQTELRARNANTPSARGLNANIRLIVGLGVLILFPLVASVVKWMRGQVETAPASQSSDLGPQTLSPNPTTALGKDVVLPTSEPSVPEPSVPEPSVPAGLDLEPPIYENGEADSAKPEPQKKVKLTVAAQGYPWVRIRIGSTIHVLDRKSNPSKVVLLKPGRYSIAFQTDEEESWQPKGKIVITENTVTLELRKPGVFVVQ